MGTPRNILSRVQSISSIAMPKACPSRHVDEAAVVADDVRVVERRELCRLARDGRRSRGVDGEQLQRRVAPRVPAREPLDDVQHDRECAATDLERLLVPPAVE
jgi:hypothetical protein